MNKYYLDTSIWLDYYEKRGKNGEIAISLINKIIKEASIVVYSDIHIKEFKSLGYSIGEIQIMLRIIKLKKLVHMNKKQYLESKNLTNYFDMPLNDALHSLIARDNEAILISRDKHFLMLRFIIDIKTPEEII